MVRAIARVVLAQFKGIAHHKHSVRHLVGLALCEGSFSPISSCFLLAPMVLLRRNKAWYYLAIAIVFSVIGGCFGYLMGKFFIVNIATKVLGFYGWDLCVMLSDLTHCATWGLILKAFMPIPFKLLTIASGAACVPFKSFICASLCARVFRLTSFILLVKHTPKAKIKWMVLYAIFIGVVYLLYNHIAH